MGNLINLVKNYLIYKHFRLFQFEFKKVAKVTCEKHELQFSVSLIIVKAKFKKYNFLPIFVPSQQILIFILSVDSIFCYLDFRF